MLEVELDLAFELVVVCIATAHFEIDQTPERVVKWQQLCCLLLVLLDLLLENHHVFVGLSLRLKGVGAAIVTGTVLGHEFIDANAVLLIDNVLTVVIASAVSA